MDHGVDILLVEDNPSDELLAMHALQRQSLAGNIHVVRDGAEALSFLFCTGAYADRDAENPKVILLDMNLPVVDGIEVLRQIRRDSHTRLVPVVMLTSSLEERGIVETYALGVNSYVTKPTNGDGYNEIARHLEHYCLPLDLQPLPAPRLSPDSDATLVIG